MTNDTAQCEHTGGSARQRDREATESRLVEAALEFVERDGVLQGLNLRDVAQHAGVARGHIYNYFGSRRQLLRHALTLRWDELNQFAEAGNDLPFAERKLRFFSQPDLGRDQGFALLTLLLLDGDDEVDVGPTLDTQIELLENDVATGSLHKDHAADLEALQVVLGSLTRGYSLFRRGYARRLGVSPEVLDTRVTAVLEPWLRSLAAAKRN